jgi:DNA-binding transcriptional ArsR family regulator
VRRGERLTDQAVELVAFRLRLFAEPTRIRLLELLNDGEASVQELSDQLDTTYQNVSRHLNVLYQAGILTRRKVDSSVRYALADWTGWWLIEQVSGTLADRSMVCARRSTRRARSASGCRARHSINRALVRLWSCGFPRGTGVRLDPWRSSR